MEIGHLNALMRHRYATDPESLSDAQWALMVRELEFVEKYEDRRLQRNIREVLVPVVNELFSKK